MQATLKKEQGLKKEYEVVIPSKDIKSRTEKELVNYSKKIKVTGFRPGKVPVNIVKQRYGESVNVEVLDKLIKESVEKIVKDNNLQSATQPDVKPEKFEEGKDFKYTVEFEVLPEIKDFDFSKIKITKPVSEAGKKDTDEAYQRIAESNKKNEIVSGRSSAKKGDIVSFDFTGKKAGVEFPGGKAEGFMLELGSGQFIPGFEDKMIGMEKGSEQTFPITFPKTYHAPDLAGADTEFTVKLHEIYEAKMPEINDEFAKNLGFESMLKLEEAILGQIKSDLDAVSFTKAKKALFDALDEKHKFEVPEKMVQSDYDLILRQMQQEAPEMDKKELDVQAKKLAERRVRLGLLLSDLAKKNNIQVTNDEVRQLLFKKAQGYPGQEKTIIEFYQKNPNAVEQLRGEVLEDKVVNFLLGKVSVTEQKVSKEELLKEDEEDVTSGHAHGVHHHQAHAEHVHGLDCDHDHDHAGHVHGPDCDHDDAATAKPKTTKKKK